GGLQGRHAQSDRAEPADLVHRRYRALLPGKRLARAAVVDQAETLTFGVFEVEREAAVTLGDLARFRAGLTEALLPPRQAFRSGNAQAGARDRMRGAALGWRRPVEERDVGAGPRERVGVEQMVGAGVVLVDGLLHHAHAHRAGVEALVASCVGRDRGEMMNAG